MVVQVTIRRAWEKAGSRLRLFSILLKDCFDAEQGNAYAADVSSISKCFGEHVPQTLHSLETVFCLGFFFFTYWLLKQSLALTPKQMKKSLHCETVQNAPSVYCGAVLESRVPTSFACFFSLILFSPFILCWVFGLFFFFSWYFKVVRTSMLRDKFSPLFSIWGIQSYHSQHI